MRTKPRFHDPSLLACSAQSGRSQRSGVTTKSFAAASSRRRSRAAPRCARRLPLPVAHLRRAARARSCSRSRRARTRSCCDLFTHAPTKERLRQFEDDLEQAPYAKEFVQPRVQALLTTLRACRQQEGRRRARRLALLHAGHHLPRRARVSRCPTRIADRERAARRSRRSGRCTPIRGPRSSPFSACSRSAASRSSSSPCPTRPCSSRSSCTGAAGGEARMRVARNRDWDRFVAELRAHGIAVFDPTPVASQSASSAALPDSGHALDAGVDGAGRGPALANS